jgi:hypothetical protein
MRTTAPSPSTCMGEGGGGGGAAYAFGDFAHAGEDIWQLFAAAEARAHLPVA